MSIHLIARLATLAFLLSSCRSAAPIWAKDPVSLKPNDTRLEKLRLDEDDKRKTAIVEAFDEVLSIYSSDQFWILVNDEWLQEGPGRGPEKIASQVRSDLRAGLPPDVVVLVRRFWSRKTTAKTDAARDVLSIAPFRIDDWAEPATRQNVVNTLAHELAHLVQVSPLDASSLYTDGKDRTACEEQALVSYRMGDLVECFYRAKKDGGLDEKVFQACADDGPRSGDKNPVRRKEALKTCLHGPWEEYASSLAFPELARSQPTPNANLTPTSAQ